MPSQQERLRGVAAMGDMLERAELQRGHVVGRTLREALYRRERYKDWVLFSVMAVAIAMVGAATATALPYRASVLFWGLVVLACVAIMGIVVPGAARRVSEFEGAPVLVPTEAVPVHATLTVWHGDSLPPALQRVLGQRLGAGAEREFVGWGVRAAVVAVDVRGDALVVDLNITAAKPGMPPPARI